MGHRTIQASRAAEPGRPHAAERRRHPRVPVFVPVSCVAVDGKSVPLGMSMGVVTNASRSGIRIELTHEAQSQDLNLAFVGLDSESVEARGKVVCSCATALGTFIVGVSLSGEPPEIDDFIAKLIRYHHYTKNIRTAD